MSNQGSLKNPLTIEEIRYSIANQRRSLWAGKKAFQSEGLARLAALSNILIIWNIISYTFLGLLGLGVVGGGAVLLYPLIVDLFEHSTEAIRAVNDSI